MSQSLSSEEVESLKTYFDESIIEDGYQYNLKDIEFFSDNYGASPQYYAYYYPVDSNAPKKSIYRKLNEKQFNEIKTKRDLESLFGTEFYKYNDNTGNEWRVYKDKNGNSTSVRISPNGTYEIITPKEDIKNITDAVPDTSDDIDNTPSNRVDCGIINIPNTETAAKMLDKLARIPKDRKIEPFSRFDNIFYKHRVYYDKYNIQIGDTWFMIPPEFILVTSESQTGKIVVLRQENTQKTKSGYHRRTIMIDLVVHGNDQINGFEVDGPDGKYYVDGLRPLLAQFKRTPFLPIFNELINNTYGIHTVALQSITIRTAENFPEVMIAQITLQEMNMMPYIEMHSFYFQFMIDWDLMRFYYQQAMTENHEYKKLQSIPINKEKNHLIMRSLSNEVLYTYSSENDSKNTNFLDIITNKDNYDLWVDSNTQDFSLLEFSCGYSNMLANVQMSEADSPTVQFMGGMDTIYNIVIETKDINIVSNFEQCRINNDLLTRNNPCIRSLGFVMLEAELVEFTGSLFVMIDTVTTNTVPGFPGLYHIQITCVAYDIGQSEREQLNGFMPFKSGIDPLTQTIFQSENGVFTKIKQDLYAENQIIRNMEVYPDLHLPTYEEVDLFIAKCNNFRKKNGLDPLPYTSYPRSLVNMLHGCQDTLVAPSDYFHPSDISDKTTSVVYDKYVDPDFYVFYHVPYEKYIEEIPGESPKLAQRQSYKRSKIISNSIFYTATGQNVSGENISIPGSNGATFNGTLNDLCIQTISAQEGGYSSVTPDDGNPPDQCLSIGKLQWHGVNAKPILQEIVNYNRIDAENILGKSLTDKILDPNTDWGHFVLTSSEKSKLETLLGKDYSKTVQDRIANEWVNNYINEAMSCGLSDPLALIYYADVRNQYGVGKNGWLLKAAKKVSKDGGGLDALHQEILKHTSGTEDRRNRVYQSLKSLSGTASNINNSFQPIEDSNSSIQKYTLNRKDFDSLCKTAAWIVDGYIVGEPNIYIAVAQSLFDRIVVDKESISSIQQELGYSDEKFDSSGMTVDGLIEEAMINVFLKGVRYNPGVVANDSANTTLPDFTIHGAYNNNSSDATVISNITARCESKGAKLFDSSGGGELGDIMIFVKYGEPSPVDIAFVIEGEDASFANNSNYRYNGMNYINSLKENANEINAVAYTIGDPKEPFANINYFAEPLIVRNSKIIYGSGNLKFGKNVVNHPLNIYNSMFTNMYQYSARSRLVRAFPTFLFCILDDQAQWYDGRKLWANYYVYQSIVDIQVHATNDMPTETAVITITNSAHNLDQTDAGLSRYNLKNDPEIFKDDALGWLSKKFYKWTGLVIGGIKITNQLIELHQKLYNHARLREGARIHLRMGYGSDPFSLAPMINGHISDITIGDQITMVVTSDGHEMIQSLTSASEKGKDVNNGFIGLFGLGSTQESSNIIAKMMVERSSWLNHLFAKWFEASKYGIEHFGIYFHNHEFSFEGLGNTLEDLWNEAKEHWDILMNIYVANYKREFYITQSDWGSFKDEENNFSFNKYNMTPWDVTQLCTQQVPEYICKCIRHQFDSRLFFGLPSFMERYRYDFFGGMPETVVKKNTKMSNGSNIITIDKDSATGKFDNDTYNSGLIPVRGGGQNVEQVRFTVQFERKHSLSSKERKETPDYIKIYGTNKNNEEVLLACKKGDLVGRKPWVISIPGVDALEAATDLSNYTNFRFEAYSCHDKLHKGKSCCEKAQIIKGEIIYKEGAIIPDETKEEEIITEMNYGNILFEECRAAAQAHYLDSMTDIIDNQIRVTNKFSNTNVKCIYIRGGSPVATTVLHSDDTIDPAYQKTTIVDTPIVQDALGPDALYEFFGYKIGQKSAERVGISTLLNGWQLQYQGEMILFGNPGIRPHDYLMINDVFGDLYGVSVCREVIHSFNSSSGFTTSVTPGLIGFDTKENSGLIVHTQNLLATLNSFSVMTQARLSNIHFVEQYISNFSEQLTVLNHACEILSCSQAWEDRRQWIKDGFHIIEFAAMATRMYHTCKTVGGIVSYGKTIANAITSSFKGITTAKTLIQGVGILGSGLGKVGVKTVGAALGLSNPVGWIVTIAIILVEKLISSIFDWISNKNVVVLLPMYWKSYPFVSGVKDGEKILLMGHNGTATNDNTKGEGRKNPNSTPEEND